MDGVQMCATYLNLQFFCITAVGTSRPRDLLLDGRTFANKKVGSRESRDTGVLRGQLLLRKRHAQGLPGQSR